MANLSDKNVMIVDDHRAVRYIVRTIVEFFKFKEIREVNDGTEAFELFKQKPADLLIVDLKMPGLGGLELIRRIRWECKGQAQRVPILVLTATLTHDNIFVARDNGANGIVAKPIRARVLCERIQSILMDKREFIVSENYIGPCRRLGGDGMYDGPERRKASEIAVCNETVSDDDIDAMLAQ